ncbi:phospholipase B1, membrane-associated [Musca domestica]|uniref:Phospholipase B1, membrane-associated n=1 Tax=Musca domestica TaxID=7370 RepID=A0A1I8MCY0_MUSDO|nr:phospholipase B1, membrane-associated [Musca domestica]XP_019893309.1 phospholipase B1, membrane-associated [Musca domestica]
MSKLLSLSCTLVLSHFLLRVTGQQQAIDELLRISGIRREPFTPVKTPGSHLPIYTNFENFRDIYSVFRGSLVNRNEKANLEMNRQRGKVQKQIPKSQPFPCSLNGTRSPEVPDSVHRLRPGDIDIIAAMGDSLTAGTAIMSQSLIDVVAEYRGVVSTGGGLRDWRTYLTLPNIFKVFNPKLYGYAIGNVVSRDRASRFNVGEGSALTLDMPYQARVLIRRLERDPQVDMARHWKVITLFIGGNDVCFDMCYYKQLEEFLDLHRRSLYKTLEILKANIPRLLVNLMSTPNIPDIVAEINDLPRVCEATHIFACHCVARRKNNPRQLQQVAKAVRRIQEIDEEVANLPEFQTDDFAVVYQPLMKHWFAPKHANGKTNYGYFGPDCFHFSQLGQAAVANMLWNNMLQPVGEKDDTFHPKAFEVFECPTEERPYLATRGNSGKSI